MWPILAILLYVGIMGVVVMRVLGEKKVFCKWESMLRTLKLIIYSMVSIGICIICRIAAGLLPIGCSHMSGPLDSSPLGECTCIDHMLQATNQFIDSACVATFLETAAVGVLFVAWKRNTESECNRCVGVQL
jgi:hypothetical protein